MKEKGLFFLIFLSLIISPIVLVDINNTVGATKKVYFTYSDTFTNRFTSNAVAGASLTFWVHDALDNNKRHLLGNTETTSTGSFTITGSVYLKSAGGSTFSATFIEFEKSGYIEEYYEYDQGGQIKYNHNGDGWTPEYQCDIYGYVFNKGTYSPASGVTVQLWGTDNHDTDFIFESTVTNYQGYFEFDGNFDNPYANDEVADYYTLKIIGSTYVKEITYPTPNGDINMGYIYTYFYV